MGIYTGPDVKVRSQDGVVKNSLGPAEFFSYGVAQFSFTPPFLLDTSIPGNIFIAFFALVV